MTKEVPGIRPAVISTETGTRLDEYRRFRHVVRNVYTHSFDPAKLGKLVNSAPELFARTKAESLRDYNGETTPVDNLECKAEEKTSHIVLVNATCFSTFS